MDVVPTRESELVELTRDYGTLQEAYSSLLKKQEDSKLAANLERRQIGEHFKILDPASLPEKPYNQKQKLLALVAGPAGRPDAGPAVRRVSSRYRDSTFKTDADVVAVLSLPVLAQVPCDGGAGDRPIEAKRLALLKSHPCTSAFTVFVNFRSS